MRFLAVVLVMGILAIAAGASAQEPPQAQLLRDTQAADLLSDLLTFYGDLATVRADAMHLYIDEIGKTIDYGVKGGATPEKDPLMFVDLFKGVCMFIDKGGGRYADPALAKFSEPALKTEFDALQHFNLQQFMYLNTKRVEIAKMRSYLEKIGKFDSYLDWVSKSGMGQTMVTTSGPTTRTGEGVAQWLSQQADTMKEQAWEKAKAQGMTREAFDAKWAEKVQTLRQSTDERIQTVKTLGEYFHPRSQIGQTAGTGAEGASGVGAGAGAGTNASMGIGTGSTVPRPGPSGIANDPRWQANYYGPNNPYNSWSDSYSDVFKPNGGGGTYARYDKRVNTDYDLRVQGEMDRRVNVSADRRMNIRVDPRVNF